MQDICRNGCLVQLGLTEQRGSTHTGGAETNLFIHLCSLPYSAQHCNIRKERDSSGCHLMVYNENNIYAY